VNLLAVGNDLNKGKEVMKKRTFQEMAKETGDDILNKAFSALEEREKRNIFDPDDPQHNGQETPRKCKGQQKLERFTSQRDS